MAYEQSAAAMHFERLSARSESFSLAWMNFGDAAGFADFPHNTLVSIRGSGIFAVPSFLKSRK